MDGGIMLRSVFINELLVWNSCLGIYKVFI